MNKTTTIILKTLAGTLAVTLLAMFAIWFMAGGVLFMSPFAVIPVYGVLFILSVLVALVTQKPIVILSVVGGFVLGVFGFNILHTYVCNPKSADVKVMKPMAEKISAYIIKNGIPESLKDIPDLPYELNRCESDKIYFDELYGTIKRLTQYSYREEKIENCHFDGMVLKFSLTRDLKVKTLKWSGDLRIESWRGTTFYESLNEDENGKFILDDFYFSCNRSGMCRNWNFHA